MNMIALIDVKYKSSLENIEDVLRHYSLRKIQGCAYVGELDLKDLDDIYEKLGKITKQKDSLLIFPICESCYRKKKVFGREIKFSEDLYRIY